MASASTIKPPHKDTKAVRQARTAKASTGQQRLSKRERALKLRERGVAWQDVAERLGMGSASAAHRMVYPNGKSKRKRALAMHERGISWKDIAEQLDLNSASSAYSVAYPHGKQTPDPPPRQTAQRRSRKRAPSVEPAQHGFLNQKFEVGDKVEAEFELEGWVLGTVVTARPDGSVDVHFDVDDYVESYDAESASTELRTPEAPTTTMEDVDTPCTCERGFPAAVNDGEQRCEACARKGKDGGSAVAESNDTLEDDAGSKMAKVYVATENETPSR